MGRRGYRETIFVDHVMALRQPPKERKPKAPPAGSKAADANRRDTGERDCRGGPAFFSDDNSFGPAR